MKKIVVTLFNVSMCVISILIPKTKKIVIIGGWLGQRFADNSKAFYLYLFQNKTKLGIKKVVFITKNRAIYKDLKSNGYYVLMSGSIKSLWYHLRSHIHIIDQDSRDINRFLSIRAVKVNLWHGFGIKKFGYLNEKNIKTRTLKDVVLLEKKRITNGNWNKAHYLAQSNEHAKVLQWCRGLEDEKIVYGVYPRIAYMLGLIERFYTNNEKIIDLELRKIKNEKNLIIFYLPTFRKNKEQTNNLCIDYIYKLEDFLIENNFYMITKFHTVSNAKIEIKRSKENIFVLPSEVDIYNFINYADIMITDYSSISTDFLVLNRPLIYFPFDFELYRDYDQGFLYDYNVMMPGPKAYNLDELKDAILFAANKDRYFVQYQESYNRIKAFAFNKTLPCINDMESLWNKINELTDY